MFNLDDITVKKVIYRTWSYRKLIIGQSGSGKTNYLLNSIQKDNALIEYSNSMDDFYDDIEDYNKKRKRKVLIVLDDMISHVMSNKKAQQVLK